MKRALLLFSVMASWVLAFGQCPPSTPLSTPYFEDFSAINNSAYGTSFNNCWTGTTTSGAKWESEKSGTGNSTGTGPADDNSYGFGTSGYYVYLETSSGSTGDTSGFISPNISLTGLSSPELSFYYHMYGATMGELEVQIWNGSQWDSVWALSGEQQTAEADPWRWANISLASYSGTIKVKFLGSRGSSYTGDMSIDDIRIGEASGCTDSISSVTINSIAAFDADVLWTGSASGSSWQVHYYPTGNDFYSGTTVTASTDSVQLTGLSSNTEYRVYVREACASSGYGPWTAAHQLQTLVSCPVPTGLSSSATTTNTATLSWTTGGATNWLIEYGSIGFTPGTGTEVSASSNTNFVLSGLSASTNYDIYVRDYCGVGDTSLYTGPIAISTLCNASTAPYADDFESDLLNTEPLCWSSYATGASAYAEVRAFIGSSAPHGGSRGLYLYSGSSSTTPWADTLYAFSPQFSDLTAGDKQVRFFANSDAPADTLYVGTAATTGAASFHAIDTIYFPTADTYREIVVPISPANGYNGTDQYVVLMHNLGVTTDYIRIDDFNYELIPPCPKVRNITLDTAGAFTATFSFDGTGSSFDYEWGPTGYTFGQATATTGSGSSNPLTVSGFSPATTYDIYIRNNCTTSSNGTSVWEGPFTFTTSCYFIAPFTEHFESYTAGLYGPNIDGCIKGHETSYPRWETEDSEGANENSLNTGPFYDATYPTSDGGMYLFLETSGGSLNDSDYLATPYIDVSALTIPYVGFAYHMYGADMGTLKLQYSDGGPWKDLFSLSGQQQTAGSDAWKTIEAPIYNRNSDSIKLRIIGYRGNGFTSDMSIDELSIVEAPSCIPSNFLTLASDSTTATSAFVSWTPGTGSKYQVEWGNAGYVPGMGALGTASVSDTFFTISGLSPNTAYDIYVRDSCSGSYSSYTGPVSFTTKCTTGSMPYYESFDAWPLSCWSQSGDQDWIEYNNTSGDNYAEAGFSGTHELNSRTIHISQDAQVRFFWSHYYSTFYSDELKIRVKIVGGSWNTILTLNGSTFDDPGASYTVPGNFTEEAILLDPAIYTGQDVIVQIQASSAYPNIYINDFNIENAPACPDPFGLTVKGLVDTSAVLSWGSSPSHTNYQVWFGPQGFYQGTQTLGGVGVKTFTTNDSLLIDTLSSNTCYEYAVRAICSGGDTTTWIGPFQFCTPCSTVTAPYTESFDSWPLSCWGVDLGGHDWEKYTGPGGDNYAEAKFWSYSNTDMIMRSRPIMIPSDAYVGFDWSHLYNASYPTDELIVRAQVVSTGVWDTLFQKTGTDLDDPTATSTGPGNFINEKIKLDPATYNGEVVIFEFIGNSGYGPDLFINNFIVDAPSCMFPTNFTSTASTTNSISLSWTTGGASNWLIEYGPTGFTPGTGTFVSATTNPFTLTGLTPGTLYDIVLRDSCGVGDVSLAVGPISVQTPCTSALSGTYTIGAGGFATLDSAVTALNLCGVSGPVVFNMTGGTHGAVQLGAINGASATNTITFNGSAGYGDTILAQGNDAAIEFDNTGYVSFNNIYAENNGGIFVVWLHNDAHNIQLDSCYLAGSRTTSSTSAVVAASNLNTSATSYGNNANNITISNNTIVGDYYGLSFNGTSSTDPISGITITDNNFEDQYYYGIRTYYVDSVDIERNDIPALRGSYSYGIYSYYNNYLTVMQNNVGDAGTYGMYASSVNAGLSSSTTNSVIANNMFHGGTAGIYSYGNQYVNYYHNSCEGGTYGMYLSGFSPYTDITVKNNIFVGEGSGTGFYIGTAPTNFVLNYNLYYSASGNIAYQGGGYATLSAWQTAQSSLNGNSVAGDPLFFSATDLHVLGSLANDAGDNTVGITVDIDGDTRPASGSTVVDMGADEYTPVSGDLFLFGGDFKKESFCLSSSDTIVLEVQNIIGSAVNFSTTPLVAHYTVSGPVNSSGSVTHNTGTLNPQDTLELMAYGIDLSMPGTYTLSAYIDSSADNTLSFNDTLGSVSFKVDTVFWVSPKTVTLVSATDSAELKAHSPFFGGGDFFISEVSHYAQYGTNAGTLPSYLIADDYVEITGVPGSDLAGITFEQWSGSAMLSSYTFPQGTVIGPNGTAIIAAGQLGASTPSPSNYYYHGTGTYTGSFSSGIDAGHLLRDAGGNIIDAVGYGPSYSFPTASGVTASDWSGNTGTTSGTAGIHLTGPDNNTASNWSVVSSTLTQDANVVNAGVTVPSPLSVAGFTWSLNGTQIDTMPNIKVSPNTAGSHYYVGTYVSPCGTYTDTVEVIVPSCLPPSTLAGVALSTTSVGLGWDSTGLGNATFEIEYGPSGFSLGNGTVITSNSDTVTITGLTTNLCQDYYVRAVCSPNDNSPWVGPLNICPDEIICTDDMEEYATGLFEGQSALFKPWAGTPGNGGTASISTSQASSGTQSAHFSNSTGLAADNDDMVAYFDTINTGSWEIAFDLYVPSNKNAYINIQQNHDLGGTAHLYGGEVYFEGNGTAQVQYGVGTVAGTFSYTQGQWNTVSTIIDLANDTIWFELNGTSTGVGYAYSISNGAPLQFNAIDFFTGTLATDATRSEFYIDDFCVSPYIYTGCNAPISLAANNVACDSVSLSWNSLSGANQSSIVEYGPSGFTPGNGTYLSYVNSPQTIGSLTPGTTYDFYVADTCGTNDTSAYSGPVSFTTLSGPLPHASFVPTVNGYKVTFDASATTGANSYSWDFGDGNSGSGIIDSNTYATGGSFTVTLSVSNGCGTDDTTLVLTDVSLLENALQQNLRLYPNPANNRVTISFIASESGKMTGRVLDLSGKEVMSIPTQSVNGRVEYTLDISRLADGVYMLEITNGSMKAQRKLIKQ